MAKKRKPASMAIDLERMPQATAAWIVGLPASRLRDRVDLAGRNGDGTWNARQLVGALVSDYKPAKLSADETEHTLQAIEADPDLCMGVSSLLVESVQRVAKRHGPAGLAAIGQLVLDELIRFQSTSEKPPSVVRCIYCKLYRWGSEWKTKPRSAGLVEVESVCPQCEAQ